MRTKDMGIFTSVNLTLIMVGLVGRRCRLHYHVRHRCKEDDFAFVNALLYLRFYCANIAELACRQIPRLPLEPEIRQA